MEYIDNLILLDTCFTCPSFNVQTLRCDKYDKFTMYWCEYRKKY